MTQRSRTYLFEGPFSNGERPDQNAFNDVWDSFINYEDDPISLEDSNYVFDNAIRVGSTSDDTNGTIRFFGGVFEFREGNNWRPLGDPGSGGVFAPISNGPNVAYNGGNVGIGTGDATPTDYLFEVRIGVNNGVANQVRMGSAVIHDRSTGTSADRAHFSHFERANDTEYALRQRADGDVNINAPLTETIRFTQNGNLVRMQIEDDTGNVVIGGTVSNTNQNNHPNANLFINGEIVMVNGSEVMNIRELLNELDSRVSALGG